MDGFIQFRTTDLDIFDTTQYLLFILINRSWQRAVFPASDVKRDEEVSRADGPGIWSRQGRGPLLELTSATHSDGGLAFENDELPHVFCYRFYRWEYQYRYVHRIVDKYWLSLRPVPRVRAGRGHAPRRRPGRDAVLHR